MRHRVPRRRILTLALATVALCAAFFAVQFSQFEAAQDLWAAIRRRSVKAALTGVTLNNGTTTLGIGNDVTSQTTALSPDTGGYRWTVNGGNYMALNMPFNSGASQSDFSGNSNTGTLQNQSAYTIGCKVGGCLTFDGVDDYMSASFSWPQTDGTVEFWMNSTNWGQNTYDNVLASRLDTVNTNQLRFERGWVAPANSDDKIAVYFGDATNYNSISSSTLLNDNTWYHLAFTWNSSNQVALYVNGVQESTFTATNPPRVNTGTFYLGRGNSDNLRSFAGRVDEVHVYSVALSPAQISQNYTDGNASLGGPTIIDTFDTSVGQVWGLSITAIATDGTVGATVNSSNTVTITTPSGSVGLNNGTTTLDTFTDVTSQISVLGPAQGGLAWTVGVDPHMELNLPFNSGATQNDYSGNGVNATLSGPTFLAVTTGQCQVGGCLSFDGVDDFVNTGQLASALITTSDATLSVWVKPTGATPSGSFSYHGDAIVIETAGYFGLYRTLISGQDRIWMYNWDTNEDRVGTTYTNGAWNHIVAVHHGGRLAIYKDGAFVADVASSNTATLAGTVQIGAGSGSPFAGQMDEVQIYDVALTAQQIAQLYTDGFAHVAAPTIIQAEQTLSNQVWDLDVTPFGNDGSPYSLTPSANTVTISAYPVTVGINSGGATLSTSVDLTSQVTGLWEPRAAYTWTVNSLPFMELNVPFNVGATQVDYSGNGINATGVSTSFSSQAQGLCKVGGCMFFDDVAGYVNTNQIVSGLITSSQGTMSVWVKPTGATPAGSAAYHGDAIIGDMGAYMGIYRTNLSGTDRIWAYNWDSNEDRAGTTYTTDAWNHIVWVHGGGRLSIYKDGALVSSVISGNTGSLASQVRFGNAGGQTFNGLLDEVQIYDVALSSAQIAQLYADGAANLAGPTIIKSQETTAAEIWDLDVIPFESNGSALSAVASANTATIVVPTVTAGLNNGTTTLSTNTDLTSQVTGLGDSQGAYTWLIGAGTYMELNLPFNSGATQVDYSGNATNATVSAAAFSAQGQGLCKVGGCMSFDGTSSFVNTNQIVSDLVTPSEGTISVWVRPTGTAQAGAQTYQGDAIVADNATYMGIYRTNISGTDRIWAYNWDLNDDRIGTTYTVDTWTHIVWVHGGGRLSLYKDGAYVGSILSSNTQVMTGQVRIGSIGGAFFEGLIDEVQVYDTALSAAQITRLYTDGAANIAGPTSIESPETISNQVWDLDVTPFEGDGSAFGVANSTNTVTIIAPVVTAGLSNGAGSISTLVDLTSQVNGLGDAQAAYTWTVSAAPFMSLNLPFNTGATQIDYSGNGVNATVSGSAFSLQGQGLCNVGGCMSFDGATSVVNTNQTVSALLTASAGTMSIWAKPTGSTPAGSLPYDGQGLIGDSASYLGLYRTNIGGLDRIWAFNWDTNSDRVGATYTLDAWNHIVWVHQGGTLSVYKDGSLVGSVASGNTQVLTGLMNVGKGSGGSFNGLLDEAQVFDVALSAAQIAQMYADGAAQLAGPTIIAHPETSTGQVWDLDVIPFEDDGSAFASVNSANTVNIDTPAVTVGLNNGTSYVNDADPLAAQVTGLGTPQGAYRWIVNGANFMSLNMPFNSGATQTDFSGSGNDGTVSGATLTATGCKVGNCMSFDGVDDQISFGDNNTFDFSGDFAVELWFKAPSDTVSGCPSDCYLLSKFTVGSAAGWGVALNSTGGATNKVSFFYSDGGGSFGLATSLATVNDDLYHHLLAGRSSNTAFLYIDGVFQESAAGPAGSTANANTMYVGRRDLASSFYKGLLDEVRIYPQVVGGSQALQNYTNGNANLAGPTTIVAAETTLTEVWNLSVTPFDSDGSTFPVVNSANTVTILNNAAPTAPTTLFVHNTDAQVGNTTPSGIDGSPVFSAIFQDPDTGNTASEYRIQVDDTNDFSSTLWDSGAAGTAIASCAISTRCANITYAGSALSLNATTYYWRIKFWDNYGAEGAFSATNQFTTDQSPTAPTVLFSNDSTAQTGLTNPVGILASHPVFSAIFNDPDGADTANKYRIQVDNNSNFASPVWDSGAAGTNMASCNQGARCSDLVFGGAGLTADESQYFWRIKFWDAAGVESPWSEDPTATNKFTMGIAGGSSQPATPAPQATIPDTPIPGAVQVIDAHTVRYNWIDASANETGFRILNAEGAVIADVGPGITSVEEGNLPANTVVSGRSVLAYNNQGQSPAAPFASAITAALQSRPVLVRRGGSSVTFTIEPAFSGANTGFPGQTAVRYELIVTNSEGQVRTITSDWIQQNEYTFEGVLGEESVEVRVITRNQEALQNEPTAYEDVAELSRRFAVTIGVFEKGTNGLPRPINPNSALSVSMRIESVGTDSASSVVLNLPLPRYIVYAPGTLVVDGRSATDLADNQGTVANQNGIAASWALVHPGESHSLNFELAFDVVELRSLVQALAAANPMINLQASVSFAESDVVYMSPVISLEPDLSLAEVPVVEVEPEETPTDVLPEQPQEEQPATVPTPEETSIIEQILQQEFGGTPPPTEPGSEPQPVLQTGETITSSDAGTFNVDVTSGDSALGLTGEAEVSGDAIRFTGTTTQPFTVITLIFNNSITAIAVSDANGFWQTFVSADRLGIEPGQEASVKIEAIAAKGDLRSERVSVGDVVVSRGRSGDIDAEFDTTVSDSGFLSVAEEIQHQVVKVIEKQEPVIQTTLSVAAPVIVVSSVPLWGYLPYAPTMIYHLITYVIGAIGRKKKMAARFYGVAYDSISKKPLALAIIRIYKVEPALSQAASVGAAAASNKKLVTTVVTDKAGRYDALLEPGQYTLEVAKPGYMFPSQIVSLAQDGDFQNVYSDVRGMRVEGETITIPDVPLDPVNAQRQWQLASGPKKLWYSMQKVGGFLAVPILLIGAVMSALVVITIPDKPINWIIAIFYIVLLSLQIKLRQKVERAWGVVYDIATNTVLPLTTIQLIEPASSKVVTSRLSDYQGRFAFLPEPGAYVIKATRQGYQQVEVVETPSSERQPLKPDIRIDKPDQRISGDIAMRQSV